MECTLHARVTCLINSPPTTYSIGSEKTISLHFIAMQYTVRIHVCTYCSTLNEPHHYEPTNQGERGSPPPLSP